MHSRLFFRRQIKTRKNARARFGCKLSIVLTKVNFSPASWALWHIIYRREAVRDFLPPRATKTRNDAKLTTQSLPPEKKHIFAGTVLCGEERRIPCGRGGVFEQKCLPTHRCRYSDPDGGHESKKRLFLIR